MTRNKNEIRWREFLSTPENDFVTLSKAVRMATGERGDAIIYASIVDDVIADLIGKMLRPPIHALLDDESGLGRFTARIDMGMAMQLYGEMTRVDLHLIRKIRNQCAHSFGYRHQLHGEQKMIPLSFSKSPLSDWCANLKLIDSDQLPVKGMTDKRRQILLLRYQATCLGISRALVMTNWTIALPATSPLP